MEAMREHDEHLRDCQPQLWHRKEDCWRIAEPEPGGYSWPYDGRKDGHDNSRLEQVVLGI
jgi:hypothetical protein